MADVLTLAAFVLQRWRLYVTCSRYEMSQAQLKWVQLVSFVWLWTGCFFFLRPLCRLDILLYQAVKNAAIKGVYSNVKSPFDASSSTFMCWKCEHKWGSLFFLSVLITQPSVLISRHPATPGLNMVEDRIVCNLPPQRPKAKPLPS